MRSNVWVLLLLMAMVGCGDSSKPSTGDSNIGSDTNENSSQLSSDEEALGLLQQQYLRLRQSNQDLTPLRLAVEGYVSNYPKDADARMLLGQVLLYTGQSEEALDQIDQAIKLSPGQASWLELAGTVAAGLELYNTSEKYYLDAIGLNPSATTTRMLLATVYAKMERFDPAVRLLLEAIQIDSRLHSAHHAMARIFLQQNKIVPAQTQIRKAIDLVHEESAAKSAQASRVYSLTFAEILRRDNEPEHALQVLLGITPASERTHPDVLHAIAMTHASMGQPEQAARIYEQLILVDPTNLSLVEQAARWHIAAKQVAPVEDLLRHANMVDPDAPETQIIAKLLNEAKAE